MSHHASLLMALPIELVREICLYIGAVDNRDLFNFALACRWILETMTPSWNPRNRVRQRLLREFCRDGIEEMGHRWFQDLLRVRYCRFERMSAYFSVTLYNRYLLRSKQFLRALMEFIRMDRLSVIRCLDSFLFSIDEEDLADPCFFKVMLSSSSWSTHQGRPNVQLEVVLRSPGVELSDARYRNFWQLVHVGEWVDRLLFRVNLWRASAEEDRRRFSFVLQQFQYVPEVDFELGGNMQLSAEDWSRFGDALTHPESRLKDFGLNVYYATSPLEIPASLFTQIFVDNRIQTLIIEPVTDVVVSGKNSDWKELLDGLESNTALRTFFSYPKFRVPDNIRVAIDRLVDRKGIKSS